MFLLVTNGAPSNLFARINFLLGLGLLIQITFYFAGVYLLISPLSALAPDWVKPAAGIAILAAAGVTVQLLSMAMSNLHGIALYGITLLLRITKTMQMALADLKSGELKLVGSGTPFEEYTKIVGVEKWRKIEQEFGGK